MTRAYSSRDTDVRWTGMPPEPDGSVAASLARLVRLVSNGASPERVANEVEAIISGWARAGLSRQETSRRIDALRDELEEGLEVAEDQSHDIDPSLKGAVANGVRVIAAIKAGLEIARASCSAMI